MTNRPRNGLVALCLAVALLAAIAAAAGVFLRGADGFTPVVSVRGEHYAMATTGVYAYNARRLVAEGVGWDIVTLFFAVPALLFALPGLRRKSLAARLFAVGILAYLFYQYLMYAVTWALGPLFLLFIAIYALSLVAMGWIIATIPLAGLPARFSDRFPGRGVAVLSFLLAALLLLMWLARIGGALRGRIDGVLLGQTTLVVQALDLGLMVPLALLTGFTAWRGRPLGYLLSPAVAVHAFAMAAAICAMLLSAWSFEGRLELPPLVVFAAVAAASVWLAVRMYRSMRPAPVPGGQT
ncbi:MAG: hypothetical protein P8099_04865 [Gemmatimonadota bacterium]|jgi:hypothetical protein